MAARETWPAGRGGQNAPLVGRPDDPARPEPRTRQRQRGEDNQEGVGGARPPGSRPGVLVGQPQHDELLHGTRACCEGPLRARRQRRRQHACQHVPVPTAGSPPAMQPHGSDPPPPPAPPACPNRFQCGMRTPYEVNGSCMMTPYAQMIDSPGERSGPRGLSDWAQAAGQASCLAHTCCLQLERGEVHACRALGPAQRLDLRQLGRAADRQHEDAQRLHRPRGQIRGDLV